ncbi:hypothetical protein T484DRAFT_1803652 [Baffinella frigidus]|nr:hypothetical protein T484DRAFT_1803652 [Cryptophyta sp. CCMP2293]
MDWHASPPFPPGGGGAAAGRPQQDRAALGSGMNLGLGADASALSAVSDDSTIRALQAMIAQRVAAQHQHLQRQLQIQQQQAAAQVEFRAALPLTSPVPFSPTSTHFPPLPQPQVALQHVPGSEDGRLPSSWLHNLFPSLGGLSFPSVKSTFGFAGASGGAPASGEASVEAERGSPDSAQDVLRTNSNGSASISPLPVKGRGAGVGHKGRRTDDAQRKRREREASDRKWAQLDDMFPASQAAVGA